MIGVAPRRARASFRTDPDPPRGMNLRSPAPRSLRPAVAVVALAALGLTTACGATEYATLNPVSDYGRILLDVYDDVLWWTIGIFVVVEAVFVFALVKFRSRSDDPDVPDQVHGHTLVEIGWTLAPAVVLFFIAIPTIKAIFVTQGDPPQRDPIEITVTGHQWWWEFEYPDLGVATANELHVPEGRTVRLTLVSDDVIHSFWAPRLGGKRDLNPGVENTLWFTPDSAGVYEGQCAELCGTSHANMRFRVFVDEPDDFEAWVESQRQIAEPDSAGFHAFLTNGCAACHAIDGTPAQGQLGPNLTHFGSRTTLASAMRPNTSEHLAGWLRTPDSVKPGALMPDLNLSGEQLDTLVTFLEGLK